MMSILIKAFNEEEKIAATLQAACAALAELGGEGEIIVADSCSTDATVAIARRFPVRIVQLADPQQRGCGAGVQLGYQFARYPYVYLLDADMVLEPGYLPQALAALQADPALAGVAGYVVDTRIANDIDRIRVRNGLSTRAGDVRCLNGGGLYRTDAIAAAGGYAADLNLKAYEEAELGMRLRSAGYRLQRLPMVAARHTGHSLGTLALLARHWRSRRAMAAGVLLRGAWGKPWFASAVHEMRFGLAMLGYWLLMLLLAVAVIGGVVPAGLAAAALLLPVLIWALLAVRKKSVRHASLSLLDWHVLMLAMLLGARYPRLPAANGLPAVELEGAA